MRSFVSKFGDKTNLNLKPRIDEINNHVMNLIREYLESSRLVSHHIDPFNDLLVNGLQEIVNREPPVIGQTCKVKFGHVYVEKPKFIHTDRSVREMYPNQARKQNSTYEGVIYANLTVTSLISNESVEHVRIPIGKIPIMVRSFACNLTSHNEIDQEECANDPGGYFIVKGKERVLVGQLRPAYNRVYTYASKPEDKYVYSAEMRSMNTAGSSVLIQAVIDDRKRSFFSLPYIKNMIPAGLVFRALRCNETDMVNWTRANDAQFIDGLITQFRRVNCAEDALVEIASNLPDDQDVQYVESILANELFYHIGALTREQSSVQLAYILKRLVAVACGSLDPDDKYNLSNKRLDTSGNLVGFLFNGLFKQFTKTLTTQLKDKKDPIIIVKSLNIITYGIATCFLTSSWATQKSTNSYAREGVSQVLSVQNYGARVSHLRRIMLPNGTKGKNSNARQLHASCFSFICPYETPEGDRVGLVTNLSLTTDATVAIPNHEIIPVIEACDNFCANLDNKHVILINGKIIGSCSNAKEFIVSFNEYRASDLIDDYVSIAWLKYVNEIHISSDAGRLVRPLFTVNPDGTLYASSFRQGVRDGRIVFRDVFELEHSVVAMDANDLKRNRCDYAEICPAATIMSVMASVIPFANHSQSPRNAYQASMGKQAIGIPCESYRFRYDTTLHVLDYPQQPITRSKMINVLKFDEMSHGAMPIVAIMTYCGFNQEDSIILNKGAIDRGLFTAMTYKTIVEEDKKRGNSDFECICLPKLAYRRHDVNYSWLSENGVVRNDQSIRLKIGDAIIGKTANRMVKKADGVRSLETHDVTIVIKSGEEGYVDSVIDSMNSDGVRVVKIRTRIHRIPEIGDKFASSTAQKGTCGMIYHQQDMPFDESGITPDLIINPHAIPSRMTINMLLEQCLNLVGCRIGKYQDATTFEHPNIERELSDKLIEAGFSDYCSQLYSGFTGEKFPCKTFMAPAFYQRLKHMVSDKIHARMAGPLDTLTHQPVAGRSRDGGLRFGTMECDSTLASGASRMVKEFMFDQSDKYTIRICESCGQIPLTNDYCQICEDSAIVEKNTPYATKLFYQLLQGMGMKISLV
jgi:DNA-directed RNA polymerase beta subunit